MEESDLVVHTHYKNKIKNVEINDKKCLLRSVCFTMCCVIYIVQ